MIELENVTSKGQEEAYQPKCPFCEAAVTKLYMAEIASNFGRRYVYYCPECRKVLGVSHRKGFWMG